MTAAALEVRRPQGSALEVFGVFLKLGLTSFGGPVAHLGYYREEIVRRRGWLDERAYADLVALCQFLPGPGSSQTGIGIGLARAGLPGALAAWVGFTLPSALALMLFGLGIARWGDTLAGGWLQGLKVVAVAVVAQAVWGMARSLCTDAHRVTVMALAAALVLAWPTPLGQVATIAAGGLAGFLLPRDGAAAEHVPLGLAVPRWLGGLFLALFFLLLLALPLAAGVGAGGHALALFDGLYRAGALVFGGGHVVLPLLQAETVGRGWLDADAFLAGYGAAQAVPGPLFTFAAFLGAVAGPEPNGVAGAALATAAIFLPGGLLVLGALPFWDALRRQPWMRRALGGINAAVVGLLLAALYDPVWTQAIGSDGDFALALGCFVLLVFWKVPPWLVVGLAAAGGAALAVL